MLLRIGGSLVIQKDGQVIGGSLVIQKDGQAITMDWNSYRGQCFEPQTSDKANGQYRLLICDGQDSHIPGKLIGYCMDNDIHLIILPPHSLQLTQPLDVGIFGPLKRVMASKIAPLITIGVSCLQKVE